MSSFLQKWLQKGSKEPDESVKRKREEEAAAEKRKVNARTKLVALLDLGGTSLKALMSKTVLRNLVPEWIDAAGEHLQKRDEQGGNIISRAWWRLSIELAKNEDFLKEALREREERRRRRPRKTPSTSKQSSNGGHSG